MRNPIDTIVETAEELGYEDTEFFRDWSLGILMALSVTDAPSPICFAANEQIEAIFQLLLEEGLTEPTVDASLYQGVFGQLTFKLTAAGAAIVDEYMSSNRKIH